MIKRVADSAEHMNDETIESLRDLVQGINDSASFLMEAADMIEGDELVANTLRSIADDRRGIGYTIGGYIALRDEEPAEEGTWLGGLRKTWASFRAGINAGDPTVVLIEAERAEDAILNKFKEILPQIAGNPINDKLLEFFDHVKTDHEQICGYRDAYQNA